MSESLTNITAFVKVTWRPGYVNNDLQTFFHVTVTVCEDTTCIYD